MRAARACGPRQRLQRARTTPEDTIAGASSMLSEPTFGMPQSVLNGLGEIARRDHQAASSAEQPSSWRPS